MKPIPTAPAHPEHHCWGCEMNCSVSARRCGDGSARTPHPAELFGSGWDGAPVAFEQPLSFAVPRARVGEDPVEGLLNDLLNGRLEGAQGQGA